MPTAGIVAIVLIVWAIILIPSERLQALLYSLPIPISIVLVSVGGTTTSAHLGGVVLLVLFFYAVHLLQRLGTWRLLAVVLAVALYCSLAIALQPTDRVGFLAALISVTGLWLLHTAFSLMVQRRAGIVTQTEIHDDSVRQHERAPQSRHKLKVLQLVSVPIATVLAALLGEQLKGFVVTFPFSGVPVSLATSAPLLFFAREFGYRSLALVAFLAAFHYSFSLGTVLALVVSWSVFGAVALGVSLVLRALAPPVVASSDGSTSDSARHVS